MCGIVGYVGAGQAVSVLLAGLKQLEYRGYDSAGIATHMGDNIQIAKTAGRVESLEQMIRDEGFVHGSCGIGHTRWATHGKPDACNAHPHASMENRVVMAHNGIIENYADLAAELLSKGYMFMSQTDTEVAVHLLDHLYHESPFKDMLPQERAIHAIADMQKYLRGSYAMAILFRDQPNVLYAVCRNSPLVIGHVNEGAKGHMLASDVTAMLGKVASAAYLVDGEIACLTGETACYYNEKGRQTDKAASGIAWTEKAADKGSYPHYMLKEIEEQPRAVRDTILPRIKTDGKKKWVDLSSDGLGAEMLADVKRVYLIGCGSAYHAACVGGMVIGRLAKIPCETAVASEFGYSDLIFEESALAVVISQSGETADSLAALRLLKAQGVRTMAIVNVEGSTMAREADAVLLTNAGPEISVATTKAYSSQLAALYLLAICMAQEKKTINKKRRTELIDELLALPKRIEKAIVDSRCVAPLAKRLAACKDMFFIGRGIDYAVSMEGSLKLKEISYIHAEAYAAGELKHGTISLIESGVPVICIATQQHLMDKTFVNASEVKCRGAQVILVLPEGVRHTEADCVIYVPGTEALFAASVSVIPLQLLAYHVSCAKGLDVDKPRNLAKSVTVE